MDEDDIPFLQEEPDSGANFRLFPLGTEFPAPETWSTNRRLDYTNQPGYPFYTVSVNIHSDPGMNDFGRSAFRRRLTERITQALPEGFTPPNRKVGEKKITWESDLHVLTLWPDDKLLMGCKYAEGVPTLKETGRRVFDALVGEYDMTTWDDDKKEEIPYAP